LPQPESSMPFTIYVNVPEDDERAIMIEKSVDAEFRTATTVEDVMCDRCRQKVTKTRTKKIRDEPNAFIVNIRRARYFGNDESDSSDFPVNFPVNRYKFFGNGHYNLVALAEFFKVSEANPTAHYTVTCRFGKDFYEMSDAEQPKKKRVKDINRNNKMATFLLYSKVD
jgi:ubiquitin C-terminal hydrolase